MNADEAAPPDAAPPLTDAGPRPDDAAASPGPGRPRVQVVYEVTEASELANLIARDAPRPQPTRPALGAVGALLGAVLGALAWIALARALRAELLVAALAVGLLAGLGAAVLGGRGRASQVAAALLALAVVLGVRIAAVHLDVAAERARLRAFATAPAFVLAREQRLAARLAPAALAHTLGDGFGLATYALVLVVAWRLPQRPRA
jgi:hypothetical protein